MPVFACLIAVENKQKKVCIAHKNYEVSESEFTLRTNVNNAYELSALSSLPAIPRDTKHSIQFKRDNKVCHVQMSKQPVGAYAFVNQGYPEKMVSEFLRKVLAAFFDKVGDKWRNFTGYENLEIEEITSLFRKYQDKDSIIGAIKKIGETKATQEEKVKLLLENIEQLTEKITALLNEYQNHVKGDSILEAIKEAEETKQILQERVRLLLENQQELDKLIEKAYVSFDAFQEPGQGNSTLIVAKNAEQVKNILCESVKRILACQGNLDKVFERSKKILEGNRPSKKANGKNR